MNTERSSARALAAIFSGPGLPFRLEEFPIPTPGPGEILVDVSCSTICGSDLHTWHGRRQEPVPCVLGHEIVGRIVSFGRGTARIDLRGEPLAAGDRITWTLAASCGGCFFCRRGLPQKCEHLFKYGHSSIAPGREFSGGFAECCLLTAGTGVVKLPDSLSDALAAPANCAVATVAAAFDLAGAVEGATVAVLGCGVLGLTAAAMARHLGAAEVVACDIDPERSGLASQFGSTAFSHPSSLLEDVRERTLGRGADVTLEFSGSAAAVSGAIAATRTGGVSVIAGTTTPGGKIELDPNDLVRRMLTIRGLHNYRPENLVTAIDFLIEASGTVPFGLLQGDRFELRNIENAFASSSSRSGRRTAVLP
ncbi:zinc-binding dehydrogenase [Luteolibacter yonseiensis]|uniref:alcohol dehydrogenase n=1 Tax=Luteolibacter yonseiensis TaxID=1144680 RepID=A0A934R851_9BACT|nr:zinc-binding dehydrogenase [Luteolibacter yonseiensis]MBK1818057.1 zinc-binding dehydrogenase [Luteolibacter yonseiensis]